ncbi:uncharacterized protein [Epargyreus clarus]|uniref:uncharacterized protein n=1 Tax=Epargyreus clarus TaxID=520877 RepID=UPI003C2CD4B0
MAPSKFGLFKARSREHGDQPSTENLLQGTSTEKVDKPPSPIPSTSRGFTESPPDFSMLALFDSEDEDFGPERDTVERRDSTGSGHSQQLVDYHRLKNQSSLVNSASTLQEDLDQIHHYDSEPDPDDYDASTSYDANSLQFDESSIASEDWSVYCAMLKKPKKTRSKDQQLSDTDMWKASNLEVMQNLLDRTGTLDEQIKWEAIATARGLCTLTDSCNCADCVSAIYRTDVADGDAGLGVTPLISAINAGCQIQ